MKYFARNTSFILLGTLNTWNQVNTIDKAQDLLNEQEKMIY